jgi:hypothetical protein
MNQYHLKTTGEAGKSVNITKNPLPNHFQHYTNFTIHEIDDGLYNLYEQSDHPAAILIKELLKATSIFLNQIPLEKDFRQSSAESKTDEDLIKVFNNIGNALYKVQNQSNDESINSAGQLVLEASINYCKTCITHRLNDLKELNSEFDTFYTNNDFELKNILSNSASISHKPVMPGM